MKICIISYSMNNNNGQLAKSLSHEISSDLIVIQENKKRKMTTIVMDILLNRTPVIKNDMSVLHGYDHVILMGPVWMQKIATPLRPVLKELKRNQQEFSVISVCGGALNSNPKLVNDIERRGGQTLKFLKQYYVADLIDKESPKMNDTSEYTLSQMDVRNLTESAKVLLNETQTI